MLLLPQEIQDIIFLKLDYYYLEKSREIQSYNVKKCTETDNIMNAIINGNLKNMKWIREKGEYKNKFYSHMFSISARIGDLEIMKWLHKEGCPWDSNAFAYAALNGNLENMKWLHKEGCPWNSYTFTYAAENGNLENMKWLHQEGCSMNILTFHYAAQNGNIKCLQWLKEQGCPWGVDTFEHVMRTNKLDFKIMIWFVENGYYRTDESMVMYVVNKVKKNRVR